jgi:predicted GNAT family N-acyltransferase
MTENADSTPRAPRTPSEWEAYYDLRWRVLREPWDQPRGSEKDDLEDESEHVMVVGADSRPLAVGRLHFNSPSEAQVRFMAVAPESQGHGLGGRVLRELERLARAGGANMIVLNARENAEQFYRNHGFVITGPAKCIFSIKHSRMRKDL